MTKVKPLTLKELRAAVKQLKEHSKPFKEVHPQFTVKVNLSTDGVVCFSNGNCMHPKTFKDIFGEEEYQKLLNSPRIGPVCGDEDEV